MLNKSLNHVEFLKKQEELSFSERYKNLSIKKLVKKVHEWPNFSKKNV